MAEFAQGKECMTTRYVTVLTGLLGLAAPCLCQPPEALDLTTRITYQRAVEEVYWQRRIWPDTNPGPKPALETVISPEQLQAKAEDALRLSGALAQYWHQPITGPQLQAEIARMAQSSKQPEVL